MSAMLARLCRLALQRVGHEVHVGPRVLVVIQPPLGVDAAILSQGSNERSNSNLRATLPAAALSRWPWRRCPSRRPMKPRPSIVVAFTPTRSTSMPRMPAIGRAHGLAVRPDLRRLAQDRHVDVGDAAAQLCDARRRIREEDTRGGAAPRRVARREVLADVAVADGAERCIGQCVQRRRRHPSGLRGAGCGGSSRRTARRDRRRRSVHVEAAAVARLERAAPGASRRSASAMSSAVVSFMLLPALGHELHRQAGPFGEPGIVGEVLRPAAAARRCAARISSIAKGLRRLRAPQVRHGRRSRRSCRRRPRASACR